MWAKKNMYRRNDTTDGALHAGKVELWYAAEDPGAERTPPNVSAPRINTHRRKIVTRHAANTRTNIMLRSRPVARAVPKW